MSPPIPSTEADCGRSLPSLLQPWLEKNPQAPALLRNGEVWSRAFLDQVACSWALALQDQGVGLGDVVGLAVTRGPERIAAVLATLKLGAACLPLDPSYPQARLEGMLEEAQPKCLLISDSEGGRFSALPVLQLSVDALPKESERELPTLTADLSEEVAYLMYTSGSTGRPKAVAMPHRPLLNLMQWQDQVSALAEGERTLQFAPLSFDVSFQEIFATLGSGGCLVLIEEEDRLDSHRLVQTLHEQKIARLFLPAVALQELANAAMAEAIFPSGLREVITAGEQLVLTPTLRSWFQGLPRARLVNQYGPSETHVATAHTLTGEANSWPELPPIGHAITGVKTLVLNEQGQEAAVGEVGELLLGGLAPALGYWRQPELSAARFVALPEYGEGLWYRSGDQAQQDADGALHFQGRDDEQIKLRGYRIELGEVEACLASGRGVGQVAVAKQDGPTGPRLVAYVVAKEGESLRLARLRRHAAEQLPEYMVPSAMIELQELPRTPSGKLARRELPLPDRKRPLQEVALLPPATADEATAVAVWCEVLALEEVGVEDNFFDLGGDSLACVRMAHRLAQQLGRHIPVTAPFRAPTIRTLLRTLEQGAVEAQPRRRPKKSASSGADDGIAIVGMHLQVPGANQLDEFWELLQSGEDAIRHFSEEEIRAAGVADELLQDPDYVRARGQIDQPTAFDAGLFGISPREAILMDPQQRLFLQACWAALEHAGYAPRSVPGAVGVWGGISTGMANSTYLLRVLHARPGALGSADTLTAMLGNQNDYLCTRVSHLLDLHGPSVAVQAACSTSLVAVIQAVESLRAGRCDMALAGGASVLFPQNQGYLHQEGDISSSDGRCRPFDREADGTLFGDGVGVVALKRLADAQADGDPIHAVIRGVAMNNDGAGRMSFSAPSASGQAEVLAMALEDAGWDPASVGMIEAHGTATPIGDPIEVDGLRQVYGHLPPSSCALGSVKSQLGHLIAAAGVSGLIKSVLALEHNEVPPTAHFQEAHPDLALDKSPFYVRGESGPWPQKPGLRRAGVSAFGLGGTNAHVLLEQAPPITVEQEAPTNATVVQLLPLNAASASALQAQAKQLADYLERHPDLALADVAKTLQQGRETMTHRAVVAAQSLEEAVDALRSPQLPRQGARPAVAEAAFLFPGGGAQYHDMGRGLIESESVVRDTIEQGLAWLAAHEGPDLARLWWPQNSSLAVEEAEALWQKPSWQLPAIYLLELATARLWQQQGIQPQALLGHSMGEYAAACLAGCMSLEEGLGMVLLRGQLFEQLPAGGMLGIALGESELRAQLGADLDLAVVNGSEMCLASGPVEALAKLQANLEQQGIDLARVRIDVAAHSRMVEQILPAFRAYIEKIDLKAPQIPIASNLSGTWLTDEEACSAEYWVRHLRETVRFADGLRLLAGNTSLQLIEVGPGRTLSSLAKTELHSEAGQVSFATLRHADDPRPDEVVWQEALGRAWCAGLAIDWQPSTACGAQRIALPTYPFADTEYFFVDPLAGQGEAAQAVEVGQRESSAEAHAFDPDMPRLERIQLRLAQILGQLSGHDPAAMNPEQPFLEMGFDSLFLTQASLAFKRAFQVRVTFRQLFNEAPTLASLAAFLDGELAEEVVVEMPEVSLAAASGETVAAGEAMVLPALHPEGADPGDQVWRFRPFKPVERGDDGGLTAQQQAHLDELIQAVNAKTPGSKRVTAAHRKTLADPRAVGGFKTLWKEIVYPIAVDRSKGSRMWDIDGNEYVDAVGGFGAVLFGHAPDFVVDAVRKQAAHNLDYGPTMELAGQLTDRLCAMTGMERASFCNTGSEAVMAAMRVARTATGKDRIATFSGDYHGLFDEVLVRAQEASGKRRNVPVAPGIPQGSNTNMMVLEYGLPASLELIRAHADDLAAVLVEPVQSRAPELQPHAFVKQLRELTEELGIPLIFDEIITGFRTHQRGAQAYYGIQADIAAYGKVIGGGIPIGVVAGKAEYLDAMDGGMWEYGDDSFPEAGVTYFAGTFVRHPLALAAMNAVMDRLEEGGEALQQDLNDRIAIFAAACNDDFEAAGLPLRMLHFASMVYPKYGGDPEFESLWFQHMRLRGLHAWEGRPGFLTTEHSQEDLDFMRRTFVEAAEAMVQGGFLYREEKPVEEEQLIPLTGPQEELWLTTRASEEASKALNEPCSFRLAGRLTIPVLQRALRKLVARHDALRAAAATDGSGLRVLPSVATPTIAHHDLRSLSAESREQARDQIYREDSREFFDLEHPPLLRVSLLRLEDQQHELLLTVHHLVADGWSISILFHDLAQFYSRMMQGRNEELGEAMPLAAFQEWEAEQKSSDEHAETLAFWRERFATIPKNLELPLDRPRPSRRSYGGDRQFRHIDAAIGRSLQEQASAQKCTLFSLLLAGYVSFLHRLTGQEDIVVGIPSAGQALLGANNLVAHCVNYLPFRIQVRASESFSSLTQRVAEEMLAINEHQDFTFGDLLQELRMPRDASRPTLIAVDFNVDPALEGMEFHGLESQYISTPRDFARLDLQLNVIEDQGTLLLECDRATDILDHETANAWMDSYEELLQAIATNPQQKVQDLPGIVGAPAERPFAGNSAGLYAPQDFGPFQSVAEMVANQARAQRSKVALVDGERRWTYGQLDSQATAFAHQLYAEGIRKGDVVALHLGRSRELTMAQLALWKIGGVCLTLDPTHPLARREALLRECECKLLLHGREAPPESSLTFLPALPIRDDLEVAQGTPWEAVSAQDPAYILFTSGSTGKPKGVVICHDGFHNLMKAFAKRPGAHAKESWLAVITPTFDMSLVEIFVPLTVGARVVLAPGDQVMGGPELLGLIRQHDIDVVQATPANWRMLLEAGLTAEDNLRIITGGEALTPALAAALLPCARELWNAYGPTETTVYACAAKIEDAIADIPIGLPIHNLGLHILDVEGQPVSPGEIGELCISGPGLALGYWSMEAETASSFPTLALEGKERRVYRSGDLARLNAHGEVQCLGRNDDQIQLRGFRIECGEVEAALELLPSVAQAAVALRQQESGEDLLVAWLRPVGQVLPNPKELRGALAAKLPAYMLPSRFVQIEELPLSDSGKVQRSALELPRQEESQAEQGEQTTESFLQQVWASMLGLPKVDLDDDFFMLGGHSLLAARMLARVENRNGLLLALEEVFRQPTIRGLAAVIEATLYQQQADRDSQDGDREELRL